MQSLNEELNTVNAELTSKVNALARTNDDMNNLLNSMQIATIFLDSDLRVKRYTEMARHIVRLIESDVGRPLSDLTSSLNYNGLVDDCRRVLATLIPQEKEVQDTKGKWHLVRLMPYRTAENVIDGVVMTIIDIDRTKRAIARMDYFQSIVQTVHEPLVVLDDQLRVVSANSAFDQLLNVDPAQIEGKSFCEIGNRQWDLPDLCRRLQDVVSTGSVISGFRIEGEFPRVGRRTYQLNARQLVREDQQPVQILLTLDTLE
ncbi:MAG: PAS domain-containing protein [Myxococcales bacterium]